MGDRELLELAAKAAGIKGEYSDTIGGDWGRFEGSPGILVDGACWNPLTDDGDALRLAVKLTLELSIGSYGTSVRRQGRGWGGCEAHLHGGNENATRRAIVHAAAEIGRAMP